MKPSFHSLSILFSVGFAGTACGSDTATSVETDTGSTTGDPSAVASSTGTTTTTSAQTDSSSSGETQGPSETTDGGSSTSSTSSTSSGSDGSSTTDGETTTGDPPLMCTPQQVVTSGSVSLSFPSPTVVPGLDPSCNGSPPEARDSFEFIAPESDYYTFAGYGFSTIFLLDGDCNGPELACSTPQDRARFQVYLEEGQLVTLVIALPLDPSDPVVHMRQGDATCPIATLDGVPAVGENAAQLVGFDEFESSCYSYGTEQSYVYTAPAAGTYIISGFESGYEAVVTVLDSSCGGDEIACGSPVTVDLESGQTITIAVRGSSPPFTSAVVVQELSGNCTDQDLGSPAAPYVYQGSTVGFGNTTAEVCSQGSLAPDTTVLYTAPTSGTYYFHTDEFSFPHVMSVHAPVCDGGGEQFGCASSSSTFNSWPPGGVTMEMNADQTVAVTVDGIYSNAGEFELHVEQPTCPAEVLPNEPATSVSGNGSYKPDLVSDGCASDNGGDSTYLFEAPIDAVYTFTVSDFAYLAQIFIIAGADCSGEVLECDWDGYYMGSDPGDEASVTMTMAAGESVIVGVEETAGDFTLQVSATLVP